MPAGQGVQRPPAPGRSAGYHRGTATRRLPPCRRHRRSRRPPPVSWRPHRARNAAARSAATALQARTGVARQDLDDRHPAAAVRSGPFRSPVGVDRHQRLASDQHGHRDAGSVFRQQGEGRSIDRLRRSRPLRHPGPRARSGARRAPVRRCRPRSQSGQAFSSPGRRIQSDDAPDLQSLVGHHEHRSPTGLRRRQVGERVQNAAQRGLLVQTANRIHQP